MMPLFSMLLGGCSSLYYLYQAGKGQLSLLNHGKPIEKVIEDPTSDPELVRLLQKIPEIRKFCDQEGLKPTPNYREYVKLDRDSVVYVVTVSDSLQFKVRIFSFPIAGSFNYIGWFKKKDAEDFAKDFEKQGMDVDVRGASAYSTLGWFKDPLLSSMIPSRDGKLEPEALPDLVNVLIHESVHATIYLKNQSYFNESVAVFVADLLTQKYFESKGMVDSKEWKAFQKVRERGKKIRKRFSLAYTDLQKIYESSMSDDDKRAKKNSYLSALQKELEFRRPITNATVVQFKTYDDSDRGFAKLFERSGNDLRRFLKSLETASKTRFQEDQIEHFDVSDWPVFDNRLGSQ